ncbi:MAG: hypothetical protein QOD74_214 [Variibacter sp.]|nr:hypothetical protein [Variibacter sp.]
MMRECLDLGLILARQFRVHLPLLFGTPGEFAPFKSFAHLCVSREIHLFAANKTSPIVGWLRALCRHLKDESGARGVGVIGMCLSGGFALALVAEESVIAPVVAQPGLPFLVHKEALDLSPEDAEAVRQRAASLPEKSVLALRYADDFFCRRERIETVRRLLGPALDYEEVPGSGHPTLTKQRSEQALERTIAFLSGRLAAV